MRSLGRRRTLLLARIEWVRAEAPKLRHVVSGDDPCYVLCIDASMLFIRDFLSRNTRSLPVGVATARVAPGAMIATKPRSCIYFAAS